MVRIRLVLIAFVALVMSAGIWPARAQPVDVALVLAVDVSRSIDDEEFQLQRRGYAQAFRHPSVLGAIRATRSGAIYVSFVEWAGSDFQRVVIPWTRVSDEESADLFAERVLQEPRSFWGWTSISGAIDYSARYFRQLPDEALRKVIDVSGDGVNNSGRPSELARDEAVAQGIVINGLVIMNDNPTPGGWRGPQVPLDQFYRDSVIGGPGAFMVAIDDFNTFAYAVMNKLVREITSLPPETRHAELDRPGFRVVGAQGTLLPIVVAHRSFD